MTEQHRALAMIAGCPNGITDGALELLHRFAPDTIAALYAAGLIEGHRQVHDHPKGLVVTRYWVTAAGRKHLNGKP